MAQNDPTYQAGDQVRVYESGQLAVLHEAGQLAGDPSRTATVLREHPSEPGTLHVVFDDGSEEFVTDHQRLRRAQASSKK